LLLGAVINGFELGMDGQETGLDPRQRDVEDDQPHQQYQERVE
jgi:hypothetical protein